MYKSFISLSLLPITSLFFDAIINKIIGTSLGVQRLRLHTPNAEKLGSVAGQGTRSHMPHKDLAQINK